MHKFDLKARGHAVEGLTVDAEDFGGAFAIVAGGIEDVEDVAALYLVEIGETGKDSGEIVGGEWWRRIM